MTMAAVEVSQLDNNLDRLSIASEDSLNRSNTDDVVKEEKESVEKWGFRLKDLYRLALRFYKGRQKTRCNSIFICKWFRLGIRYSIKWNRQLIIL
jgi:hypothetical protein